MANFQPEILENMDDPCTSQRGVLLGSCQIRHWKLNRSVRGSETSLLGKENRGRGGPEELQPLVTNPALSKRTVRGMRP